MKILMWVALVIACIALGLSIVMFTNLSGRVDNLEGTTEEHSVWIEKVEEGLESIGEALIEGAVEIQKSLDEALKSLDEALIEGAEEIQKSLDEIGYEGPLPEE